MSNPVATIIPISTVTPATVSCANCQACCCRLEVMIISDTGVPDYHISTDQWGGQTMLRLADGWCSALNRDTYRCTIYDQRPWVCREFAMGSDDCLTERAEFNVGRSL